MILKREIEALKAQSHALQSQMNNTKSSIQTLDSNLTRLTLSERAELSAKIAQYEREIRRYKTKRRTLLRKKNNLKMKSNTPPLERMWQTCYSQLEVIIRSKILMCFKQKLAREESTVRRGIIERNINKVTCILNALKHSIDPNKEGKQYSNFDRAFLKCTNSVIQQQNNWEVLKLLLTNGKYTPLFSSKNAQDTAWRSSIQILKACDQLRRLSLLLDPNNEKRDHKSIKNIVNSSSVTSVCEHLFSEYLDEIKQSISVLNNEIERLERLKKQSENHALSEPLFNVSVTNADRNINIESDINKQILEKEQEIEKIQNRIYRIEKKKEGSSKRSRKSTSRSLTPEKSPHSVSSNNNVPQTMWYSNSTVDAILNLADQKNMEYFSSSESDEDEEEIRRKIQEMYDEDPATSEDERSWGKASKYKWIKKKKPTEVKSDNAQLRM